MHFCKKYTLFDATEVCFRIITSKYAWKIILCGYLVYACTQAKERGDVFRGDFQSLRFLLILLLLRSIKSSIIAIKSSSSSFPYFFRAYSRNSGHSIGEESFTGGKWPTMTSTFSTGSPANSARVRQDCGLGLSLPDSHRLTVAWLTPKSVASWLGNRCRLFINSRINVRRRSFVALTGTLYSVFDYFVKRARAFLMIVEPCFFV